ncbi:integrase core domain-containing protein [Sediminispirochaeta smaragdinae]|uniref:integrase core domain-containing protein n=1 Tax=Sediminispirochaeta smaragdinae TaxID=55206 RepID=UPI000A07048D|nr:integrase core domain-containing protein [Sediminispirochaeta smaragdinae]
MENGRYCYPLTICDSFSRFILAIKGLHNPNFEETKPVFIDVFKDYGLPVQLHTDNGSPFASIRSLGRITKFAVWLMELGVQPVYSDPASPQQNGRHERMHRELKAAACTNPGKTLQAQQRKMNEFMREYDEVRPHEALGMGMCVPEKVVEYRYLQHYRTIQQ